MGRDTHQSVQDFLMFVCSLKCSCWNVSYTYKCWWSHCPYKTWRVEVVCNMKKPVRNRIATLNLESLCFSNSNVWHVCPILSLVFYQRNQNSCCLIILYKILKFSRKNQTLHCQINAIKLENYLNFKLRLQLHGRVNWQ